MRKIELVVFDWAGTTVDFGCFAPVSPFMETLRRHGVNLSAAEARVPMGLHKKDHIRELLKLPHASEQWLSRHGSAWTEDDIDRLFREDFVPLQMSAVADHTKLIPGLLDCVDHLRKEGIKIATTTGYFKNAAEIVYKKALQQGYSPDANLCAEDVPQGRPAPWMIFQHMQTLNVYPPAHVLKLGDTIPDIEEGRNAGAWSVGVSLTGSEVGLSEEEVRGLSAEERKKRHEIVAAKFQDAGAHYVMESVADLPKILDVVQKRLLAGENP